MVRIPPCTNAKNLTRLLLHMEFSCKIMDLQLTLGLGFPHENDRARTSRAKAD